MKKFWKRTIVPVVLAANLITGCGGNTSNIEQTVTTAASTGTQNQSESGASETTAAVERTKQVRLEVINIVNGVDIHIIGEDNKKITGEDFTICFAKASKDGESPDPAKSGEVEGEEFSDDDRDGVISVSEYDSGSYVIYLRPHGEYLDATPIPISYVSYKYDEDIMDQIKQKSDIDASMEDQRYIEVDENGNQISQANRDKAIKVTNMINAGFIKGETEVFDVMVPILTEDGEIQYEKVNITKRDGQTDLTEYIKEENREVILVGGEKMTVYVYEKARFDARTDEEYISSAFFKDGDNYSVINLMPHMKSSKENIYVGWYSKKGKHYYNDPDGYPVNGWVKLDGMWYYFKDGQKASVLGVDISEYQEEVDFVALKEGGIDFVIIRCGFRGWSSGTLVEDARFRENIAKADAAGMPYGVYIFSQAINQYEAAQEASMIMEICEGYSPSLPYAIDIEACGSADDPGRQNLLNSAERTMIINTFASVIESRGGEPMLYSNKSYIEHNMNISEISCKLWYAMWPGEDEDNTGDNPNNDALEPDPNKIPNMPCEIWQYSSVGQVDGIEPVVDLNAWVPSDAY